MICEEGKEIVPIKFLKELLPDPASLGPRTHGKTNIGCIFTGSYLEIWQFTLLAKIIPLTECHFPISGGEP